MDIRKNENGQGLVEYLILVCLVAVSAIAVVSTVGTNIKEQYANISKALGGQKGVKLSSPDAGAFQHRGMNDYAEGAGATGVRGFFP
jgi:Flp pilus assembly pilin Flp